MAGYDPQRNRSRRRPETSMDEPAPVDALLGPTPESVDRAPDPVPVAVNDEAGPAPEPMADLRAVPDPVPEPDVEPDLDIEVAVDPEPVPEPVVELTPEPLAEPAREVEALVPASASMPSNAGKRKPSPAGKIAAALIAVLALLAFLVAWARRRR